MTTQAKQDKLIAEIRALGYSAKRTAAKPNVIDVWSDAVPVGMVQLSWVWGAVAVSAKFCDTPTSGYIDETFRQDELDKVMRIAARIALLRANIAALTAANSNTETA